MRWSTFRDLFTAIYINNPSLTPVEKLFHLNAKTSGDAHNIVSSSPLTNDGFRLAWAYLTFVCFSTKAIHLEPTSDLTT